jgi:hypothetical protein
MYNDNLYKKEGRNKWDEIHDQINGLVNKVMEYESKEVQIRLLTGMNLDELIENVRENPMC